ncbi:MULTISPECIES: sodium:proton exchanger [Sphingomonadales]|uniref:Sodium:proton exchanger n=3 Tax=Sphingomonadales TaxID=204457 RepID=A0AA42X2S5_SPHYA|nr:MULTISPECIES: sodium:proton exchanger [Sphingomonadaceae]MDH2134747.1 sodium:proton exchanger [Sphingobium yanoikuyae]MDH2151226.1 sodium:proton exchanger [Sphingobium yanoikuyae]MDH2169483.1 sodium:proton exchanger [Sphingobium yanoikuyae]
MDTASDMRPSGEPRPSMRRFVTLVAITAAAMIPAIVLRIEGWRPNPILDAFLFGAAILAGGFFLSWGAEAAEKRISAGLIVAIVALITVLPEYAVDFYYAYSAGANPGSNYVHYAAANMTGANRLLVGLAWPLLVLLHWRRTRERAIPLLPANRTEVLFLLLPSVYAFTILLKDAITVVDTIILVALFGVYMWRASEKGESAEDDDDDEPGPAAALAELPAARQWLAMGALTVVAAAVILISAEPFAEAMVESGRLVGFDEFLLIQWLAPLASEAPAVVIAVLFVLSGRAETGLATMISDKINQWTLLVGMLPLALSLGAGQLSPLPLDARQHEEFFLTAAQSLFGIALLLRLRLGLSGAAALAGLFAVQVTLAVLWQGDEARTIASLTWLAWAYIGLAFTIFALNVRTLPALAKPLWS